jgi:hypothetical protein
MTASTLTSVLARPVVPATSHAGFSRRVGKLCQTKQLIRRQEETVDVSPSSRTSLVTGGGSGIGKGVAATAVEAGGIAAIVGRNAPPTRRFGTYEVNGTH